jgi:inner membrane protein
MMEIPKASLTLKLIGIGFLALLLFIPTVFFYSVVQERTKLQEEVITDISSKWGRSQTLLPLMMSIPTTGVSPNYVHVLPDSVSVNTTIIPEVRHRDLYQAVVYTAKINIRGHFNPITLAKYRLSISEKDMRWDKASILLGITDVKGVDGPVKITWNGEPLQAEPGLPHQDVIESGVHAFPFIRSHEGADFEIEFNLRGSQKFFVLPAAAVIDISMDSPWKTPSFQGDFLPNSSHVDRDGFAALWRCVNLNMGIPQAWVGKQSMLAVGTAFIDTMDMYRKIERSVKYALLIIAVTFFSFLLTEIMTKTRFHPVQYLLVGAMISLFYFLLLSFSEYIGFAAAYWLAFSFIAVAIVGYTRAVFKNYKVPGCILLILTALYSYTYTLFLLENYALLAGSLGLFILLSGTMYITRKMDWYGFES